jgi:hypothetical protein
MCQVVVIRGKFDSMGYVNVEERIEKKCRNNGSWPE